MKLDYTDLGLMVLKMLNNEDGSNFTRIKFSSLNGETGWIEDYTPFATKEYMSDKLLDSLKTGTTLTNDLEEELSNFKVDIDIVLPNL